MSRRWIYLIAFGGVALFALLVAIFNPLPPLQTSISTGSEQGAYYAFAQQYETLFEEEGFTLDVIPGAGSVQTLERLVSGEVESGIVQGGTAGTVSDSTGLFALGSMFYEPIWLFHRADQTIEYLYDLAGKRIAIGVEGSGIRPVALALLEANGITSENADFRELNLTDAVTALESGEIDAAFFIISPTASLVTELVENTDIELFSFQRAQAYRSRFTYMNAVTLGEGSLDLIRNLPDHDITLMATTATLVVREDMHPNLVRLLLRQAEIVHSGAGVFEEPNEFPSTAYVEFPLHEEARRFFKEGNTWFENNFPYMLAAVLDRLVIVLLPLLTLLYPVVRGALPLYSMTIRRRIKRWYETINEVDRAVATMSLDQIDKNIAILRDVEQEVTENVNVPVGYMDEFYQLRLHINLVQDHLIERKESLSKP